MTGNAIGDIGLFHLSKALRENQILEVLSLAANGISEKDSLSPFNIHLLNTHLNMDAGFPQYVAGGGGLGSDRSSNINNSSSYSSSSDSSPSPTQSQTLDSSINSEQQQQQQLLQQEGEGGGGENRNQSVPSSAVRTQRQLQQQQYQEEQLQQTFPGLLAFCISLASKNLGLSVLDLRGNHFGNLASKQILEMMAARKSACNSKRAAPLIVHITERIAGDVFDRILDFNDVMGDLSKKMFKKKK